MKAFYSTSLLFICALLIRLLVVFMVPHDIMFPDSKDYHHMALNILNGKGAVIHYNKIAFRPPGYPYFLALIYLFFGQSVYAVQIVQACIGALSSVLIYFMGKLLFHERIGILAGFIAAGDPCALFFTTLLLHETITTFFLLVVMLFLIQLQRAPTHILAFCVGVFSALLALLSSSCALFLPGACLAVFFPLKKRSIYFSGGLLCMLGIICVSGPWILRNAIQLHAFIPFTTQCGMSLYESVGPAATGGPNGAAFSPDPAWKWEQKNEVERDRLLRRESLAYIKKDVWRFMYLAGVKCMRMWNIMINYQVYRTLFYTVISVLFYVPLFICAFIGLIRCIGKQHFHRLSILLLPILYVTLIHMIFIGSIRYRVPVMPYMIILAAYGIYSIIQHTVFTAHAPASRNSAYF